MTEAQVIYNYNDKGHITSYYTIHDTLYDMDSNDPLQNKTFYFDNRDPNSYETESVDDNNKIIDFDRFKTLKTYYTADGSTIVDVDPEGEISLRDNTGVTVEYNSTTTPIYSQICRLEADTAYDSKKHYYRVNSFGHNQNTNYTIKGNVIVFNNIQSQEISVDYTKYTRKHDKDKTYFHGAEDGLFMHENKKRSVANAMNEDIKVMIRQNEQMMVLGGITLATLVVGAYVILRN